MAARHSAGGGMSFLSRQTSLLLLRLLRGWMTVLAVLRDKLSLPPGCARSLYKLYRSRLFALNRSDRAVKSVSQICKIRSLGLLRGWGRGAVNFFARGGQPTNPRPCTKAAAGWENDDAMQLLCGGEWANESLGFSFHNIHPKLVVGKVSKNPESTPIQIRSPDFFNAPWDKCKQNRVFEQVLESNSSFVARII